MKLKENTNEITRETLFKILAQFIRIKKKFDKIERMQVDIGDGEKLYPSEIHVIVAIGNNQGKTVTEISKKFGITKGAISQVVNKLLEKGFINKERNKAYGKEIILSLTKKGQKAFKIQDKFHQKMEIEFINHLETFTPQEIDSFMEIMAQIEEYIDTFLKDELP